MCVHSLKARAHGPARTALRLSSGLLGSWLLTGLVSSPGFGTLLGSQLLELWGLGLFLAWHALLLGALVTLVLRAV